MVALILNCLILDDGSPFRVEVNDGRSVSYLKKEIAKKKMYDFPAYLMKLYLAQREGAWFLSSDGESVRKLSNGESPDEIEYSLRGFQEMNPNCALFEFFDPRILNYKVIHVLVKLHATDWERQKQEKQDVTETYADHLRDVDMHALSSPGKLEAFISSPLRMKYPTEKEKFVKMFPDVFEYSENKFIELDTFSPVARANSFTNSKVMNISQYDTLIRMSFEDTAKIMDFPVQVGRRNLKEPIEAGSKTPDFLLWVNNTLVLKGQERGSLADFGEAEGELAASVGKMHLPVFGEMPFLFAYAAANSWIQFFAIDRSLNVSRISKKLDLMKLKGRIQCVLSSINICRIIYHYQSMLPVGYLPMYKKMQSTNGSATLYEDYVLKTLERDPYDYRALLAIYEAIQRSEIPCTVRCDYKTGKRRFILRPIGFARVPTCDVEIIAALICVARALLGLHGYGYVHRAICWPHILCLGNEAYILNDFESAGQDGDPLPGDMLSSAGLDPLVISDVGHVYRSCNDMYQFGQLIGHIDNTSLQYLKMNLESPNAAKRYTAETALSHLLQLQNATCRPT